MTNRRFANTRMSGHAKWIGDAHMRYHRFWVNVWETLGLLLQ